MFEYLTCMFPVKPWILFADIEQCRDLLSYQCTYAHNGVHSPAHAQAGCAGMVLAVAHPFTVSLETNQRCTWKIYSILLF